MTITPGDLSDLIRRQKVIPVLRAPTFRDPLGITESLVAESFPIFEFTLTADNALDAIEKAREIEGSVVGCGTVTTSTEALAAREAGAQFLVAPALLPEVAEATELPTMLAGFTPSELHAASQLTGWLVKLFPSATAGPRYIRSVLTVFSGLQIVAAGGIVPKNAFDFMAAGATAVASGFPGPAHDRIEPTSIAAGARALRESIDRAVSGAPGQ